MNLAVVACVPSSRYQLPYGMSVVLTVGTYPVVSTATTVVCSYLDEAQLLYFPNGTTNFNPSFSHFVSSDFMPIGELAPCGAFPQAV